MTTLRYNITLQNLCIDKIVFMIAKHNIRKKFQPFKPVPKTFQLNKNTLTSRKCHRKIITTSWILTRRILQTQPLQAGYPIFSKYPHHECFKNPS